jgi:hypothetical protein
VPPKLVNRRPALPAHFQAMARHSVRTSNSSFVKSSCPVLALDLLQMKPFKSCRLCKTWSHTPGARCSLSSSASCSVGPLGDVRGVQRARLPHAIASCPLLATSWIVRTTWLEKERRFTSTAGLAPACRVASTVPRCVAAILMLRALFAQSWQFDISSFRPLPPFWRSVRSL